MSSHGDISVVVTCFDYGDFVGEAVVSALEQDGGAPRVIVVDDGSTDPATLDVLERLPRAVHVVRQENAGPAAARNVGMAAADTPYLVALDADDRLAPGALRAMRTPLDEQPDLGFAYGVTEMFGTWSGPIAMPPYDPYGLLDRSLVSITALMRRSLFDDVGGFDPAFRQYEDWEFWLHATARGWRGRRVPETTLLYRRHGTSNHHAGRSAYRAYRRCLQAKHRDLYARRAELAKESTMTPVQRAVNRAFWGPRPVPAGIEHALQARLFRD